jgi:hypothetical protein
VLSNRRALSGALTQLQTEAFSSVSNSWLGEMAGLSSSAVDLHGLETEQRELLTNHCQVQLPLCGPSYSDHNNDSLFKYPKSSDKSYHTTMLCYNFPLAKPHTSAVQAHNPTTQNHNLTAAFYLHLIQLGHCCAHMLQQCFSPTRT